MICACYSVYNCAGTLEDSIKAILPHVDKLIFVDGICLDLYWSHHCAQDKTKITPWSTDGTREIISKYAKKYKKKVIVHLNKDAWIHEVEKRNKYLELANGQDGDYYAIVDGDEIWTGDVEAGLKEIVDSGRCGEVMHEDWVGDKKEADRWYLRIWRHVPGIHYCRVHTMLFDAGHVPLPSPFGVVRTDRFKIMNVHKG